MGTWGAGSFQNDSGLDCLANLRESEDASYVHAALSRVVEHGGTKYSPPSILERLRGRRRHTDWLDADVAQEALAAAEIIAAWLDHPAADLPDGTLDWVKQHASSFQSDLVPLAVKAVNIVKTNSELKDLWDEGDASKWMSVVADLERRLNSPSPKQ